MHIYKQTSSIYSGDRGGEAVAKGLICCLTLVDHCKGNGVIWLGGYYRTMSVFVGPRGCSWYDGYPWCDGYGAGKSWYPSSSLDDE